MNIKLIVFTGVCLLAGFCQGAETPSGTTGTTNLPTETTSSSTSSTTTPPQSKTWVVIDKTTNEACTAARIISQFDFAYPVEIKADANIATGNAIVIAPLDNSTEATRLCTNTSESITLKWDENSVEIDFKLGEDKKFFVSPNTLNKTDQQNCSGNETVSTYNNDSNTIKTQVDVSYKCDKVQQVNVNVFSRSSSAILSISHTKFQASGKEKYNGPGLVVRPMPENTLIRIKAGNYENVKFWENRLDEFLEEYKKPRSENAQSCRYDRLPQPGKVCDVEIRELPHCNSQNRYSYYGGKPCIFLKLIESYGWKPMIYNGTTPLPDKMPQELKKYIEEAKGYYPQWTNNVWVTCEGQNPADVEHMGPIHYLPERGLPGYFFPYLKQEGYLGPLVAVYFENPAPNVRINIVCKAWAHNLDNDGLDSIGSVHFGLMVEKAQPSPDKI